MRMSLTGRHEDRISGVLSCYDRIVVTGTLPTVCYAEGMTRFLCAKASSPPSHDTDSMQESTRVS